MFQDEARALFRSGREKAAAAPSLGAVPSRERAEAGLRRALELQMDGLKTHGGTA